MIQSCVEVKLFKKTQDKISDQIYDETEGARVLLESDKLWKEDYEKM